MATTTDVAGVQMIALKEIRPDQNVRELAEEVDALAQSIALSGRYPGSVRPTARAMS